MRFFFNKLGIQHGEISDSIFIFLLFFISSLGGCIALNSAESLFIQFHGVEDIPVAFLITAILTIAVALLTNFLQNKFKVFRFSQIFILISAFIISVSVGFSYIFPDFVFLYYLLFVLSYTLFNILKSVIFNIFQHLFDLRQVKRIFPFVSSGAILGISTGGFLTSILVRSLKDTKHLMLIWIGLIILTALMSIFYFRIKPNREDSVTGHKEINFSKVVLNNFAFLKQSPLYFYLTLMSVIAFFTIMHFDFLYMYYVKSYFKETEKITEVFGQVRGTSTIAAFFNSILYLRTSYQEIRHYEYHFDLSYIILCLICFSCLSI